MVASFDPANGRGASIASAATVALRSLFDVGFGSRRRGARVPSAGPVCVSPEAGWLPANLFLPKPVDPARLLGEVRRLTGQTETVEAQAAVGREGQ